IDTPIIMLTARGSDSDRIAGLEAGADDYLPKPFNPNELLARIRAVLRRQVRVDKSRDHGPKLTTSTCWLGAPGT
ncbi:response regulator, partial [Acinetobacter baumannii]|uniref:response regulator n=1 Tax=Acinetobacter baumannii TaxID=470 RepID=UPI001D06C94C